MESSRAAPPAPSFAAALRFWLKLGFISFGGPAGQIAIMHSELVETKRWISERRFLHALNYCMVLPGPEAQQLATYIGWLLHGVKGGIVAGALFVLPSLFLLVGLSWIYVAYGQTVPVVQGAFVGIRPAVAAVVAFAVIRIGSRSIRTAPAAVLAAAAFAALEFKIPYALIVVGAGACGLVIAHLRPGAMHPGGAHGGGKSVVERLPAVIDDHHEVPSHARLHKGRFSIHLLAGLALWGAPITALFRWQGADGTYFHLGWFFTQAALLTFGGAYAVLPFVGQHAMEAGWLDRAQIADGLALGETTPGPLIMFVAFVGFLGGHAQGGYGYAGAVLGAVVATYFTFLPSFLFILLGGPFVERTRGELRLSAILSGIAAAVVGVVLHLAVQIGRVVCFPGDERVDWAALVVAAISFAALWRFKASIVRVVLACGAAGIVGRLTGVWGP